MTRASLLSASALGAALAALFPAASMAQPARPSVEELKRLVEQREQQLRAVQAALGRTCSDEPLREAQGAAAVARARLAQRQGRRDDLLAALPKVVAYHEWRIQRWQSLLLHKAIPEEEARAALKESETELRWARERLACLRGDQVVPPAPPRRAPPRPR